MRDRFVIDEDIEEAIQHDLAILRAHWLDLGYAAGKYVVEDMSHRDA